MTITDFLLARIAEDEADASEANEDRLWRVSQADDRIIADAGHMQRFMPSRMLAECEAKRRIVELHRPARSPHDGEPDGTCRTCADLGPDGQGWPCDTLAALASVYADHPDYRSEWRP